MTRTEWEGLSLASQISCLKKSPMWDTIDANFEIINVENYELDEYITFAIHQDESLWESIRDALNGLTDEIEHNITGFVFMERGVDCWDELHELTKTHLGDIVDKCRSYDKVSYDKTFDIISIDMSGVEELIL